MTIDYILGALFIAGLLLVSRCLVEGGKTPCATKQKTISNLCLCASCFAFLPVLMSTTVGATDYQPLFLAVNPAPCFLDVVAYGEELYVASRGIVTGLAALLMLFAFMMQMLSKDPRQAQMGASWLKRIVICYILFNLLGIFTSILYHLTFFGHS